MTRRALAGLLSPVFALVLLSYACGGIKNPEGWADPVVSSDGTYIFRNKERLSYVPSIATNAATQWRFPNPDLKEHKDIDIRAVYGEPIVESDRVYLASYEGEVFALNRTDGSIAWRRGGLKGGITGRLAVTPTAILFGTIEGRGWSLDKANGATTAGWPNDGVAFNDPVWASVAVEADKAFFATMGGEIHALNLKDGSEAWAKPFKVSAAIPELALVAPGKLFAPSLNKKAYIVDAATGTSPFEPAQASHWIWMLPAVNGNLAYFADFNGRVYSLDITTGASRQLAETHAKVKATPAIVGGMLLVADRDRYIHFFDLSTGAFKNKVQVGDSGTFRAGLTVNDGIVYAITTKGDLYRANPAELSVVEVPIGGPK